MQIYGEQVYGQHLSAMKVISCWRLLVTKTASFKISDGNTKELVPAQKFKIEGEK